MDEELLPYTEDYIDFLWKRDITIEAWNIENEIDDELNRIADEICDTLDFEEEQEIIFYPNYSDYHYSLFEYIKYKYLFNNDLVLKYNLDMDDIAHEIIEMIIAMLLPEFEYEEGNEDQVEFYICLYFSKSDKRNDFFKARKMYYEENGEFPYEIIESFLELFKEFECIIKREIHEVWLSEKELLDGVNNHMDILDLFYEKITNRIMSELS